MCQLLIGMLMAVVGGWLLICTRNRKIFPPPYSQPNIFTGLKAVIFYALVSLRKRNTSSDAGYGAASYNDVALMEKPQKLGKSIKAVEAVFFSGANKNGWGVILAMQRRPSGVSTILAYVKKPDGEVLVPPNHPDCFSFRSQEDEMLFKAGGLHIVPLKPMEEWQINFKGILRNADSADAHGVEVSVNLRFKSNFKHFDYDTEMDQWTISKSFAREPWTRRFFNNLKSHHQTHYEQMGDLVGSITIDGAETQVEMPSFRDHSYGIRDWSLMHRYTFQHIFLENGEKGVVGVVCQPSTCSRLVCGHWWKPNGEGHPITDVDLFLHEHGEKGTPPSDYGYSFVAGGITHIVKVKNDTSHVHHLGWDWEAKFFESFVKYEVDGIPGFGITEWEYKNTMGRPIIYTENDPDWTSSLRYEYLTT